MKKLNSVLCSLTGLAFASLLALSPAHADKGGESGGGGDALALEFKATAEVALKNLQAMHGAPFSSVSIAQLQNKINSAQILISDTPLSISEDGVIQNSSAENNPGQNLIVINRSDYTKIENATVQQSLALHEFLSLLGLESTGNYPISGQYLIAEGGGTLTTYSQAIAAAAKSAATQTACPMPTANAAALFSMIMDSGTPAEAIQSFLRTHIIGVDVLNDQCETTFEVSIDKDRKDVFAVLFNQYKPNLSAPQSELRDSIYSYALEHATLAMFEYLKSEASLNQQVLSLSPVVGTDNGYSAGTTDLMLASLLNPSVSLIQNLIKNGSSVKAVNAVGVTALMFAANLNSNPGVAQELVRAGANVNVGTPSGATALMMAAEYNSNPSMVQALIQAGANVNAVNSDGTTALIVSTNSNLAVVQTLIQAGTDVNAANANGTTALLNAAAYCSDVNTVGALIQAGANVNVQDVNGTTALMNAIDRNPNPAVVKVIIQAGANVNATDANGTTALSNAVDQNPNLEVTQALIQAGADVNSASSNGVTVLMNATFPFNAANGGTTFKEPLQDEIIQVLLKAGARLNAKDENDHTALDNARHYGAPQSMITLLGG
jgi:ankyrin repeat protein